MEDKIFIVLRTRDQVEDLIPYLERMAKPGMKLVCLVFCPVKSTDCLRDHWLSMEAKTSSISPDRTPADRYSSKPRKLVEEKVIALREAMMKKSVNVDVDFCTGRLKKIVLDRTIDKNIRWLIIPAQLSRLLERDITPFAQFKWALFCSRTPAKQDSKAKDRRRGNAFTVEKIGS